MAKTNGLSVIVSALVSAYAAVQESGGLLDNVCNALQKLYRGADVPDSDAEFIADEVARQRSWSATSAKPRKSEMRTILSQYPKLPDAMARVRSSRKSDKPVTFEAGLKLARSLKKGSTVNQAAAAYIAGGANRASDPSSRTRDEAIKSIRGHMKRVLQFTQIDRKFRTELRSLCEEFGIVV